jgi:hypothetical protein
VMPDEMQGTGFGLVRTVYLFSASSGPVIIGRFGDAGMFDTAFLLLAVIAAIALLLCRSLPEP